MDESFTPKQVPVSPEEQARVAKLKEEIMAKEKYISNICRSIVFNANQPNPEELSQIIYNQVLFKALKNAGSYKGDGSLDAWLSIIAKNSVRDYIRLIKRTPDERKDSKVNINNIHIKDTKPNPEDMLLAKERRDALRKAINMLAQQEQKIINLEQQGFKIREIAEKTNKPMGTIKTAIARIRIKIAKHMGMGDNFKIR